MESSSELSIFNRHHPWTSINASFPMNNFSSLINRWTPHNEDVEYVGITFSRKSFLSFQIIRHRYRRRFYSNIKTGISSTVWVLQYELYRMSYIIWQMCFNEGVSEAILPWWHQDCHLNNRHQNQVENLCSIIESKVSTEMNIDTV